MPNYEERVTNVNFKMDENFNIVECNRSFQRFFDCETQNVNLKDLLEEKDFLNFKEFIKNFKQDDNNHQFIINIQPRLTRINCLFHVEYLRGQYNIDVTQLEYNKEIYYEALLANSEYRTILDNVDLYYCIYDYLTEEYQFKNTKGIGNIYKGSFGEVVKILKDRFELDVIANKLELIKLESDVESKSAGDEIVISTLNKQIKLRTTLCKVGENDYFIITFIPVNGKLSFTDSSNRNDGLTDVLNRKNITSICQHMIGQPEYSGTLMIIDVDRFKECNDTFGHAFGDQVLVALAKVLKDSVGSHGYIGRYGGDEFVVLLDVIEEEDIRNIARNIRLGIQWAIPALEPDAVVSCSIGCARFPLHASTYDEVFSLADKCLYIAKNKGRNCYVIYKPEIHDQVIVKSEEEQTKKSTGEIYMNIAHGAYELLTKLRETDNFLPLFDEIQKYGQVSRITYYDKNKKMLYTTAEDLKDIRKPYLKNEDYYKYYNKSGFLLMDNVNALDTLDKSFFDMYLKNNIASTLEIDMKDKGLLCFDVYKPARTFKDYQILFFLNVAEVIKNK